jgi:hypothetical protein
MKRLICLVLPLIILFCSCAQNAPHTAKTEEPGTSGKITAAETSAVTEEQTDKPLPDNVTEEDGVLVYHAKDYVIRYPKGFNAVYDGGKLTLSPESGKGRYVTVEPTDIPFSDRLSAKETAEAVAVSLSATLTDGPETMELGGAYCVRFGMLSGGAYVTGYICRAGGPVYIMCAGTEDKEDDLPVRIAQTVKFNIKENAQ